MGRNRSFLRRPVPELCPEARKPHLGAYRRRRPKNPRPLRIRSFLGVSATWWMSKVWDFGRVAREIAAAADDVDAVAQAARRRNVRRRRGCRGRLLRPSTLELTRISPNFFFFSWSICFLQLRTRFPVLRASQASDAKMEGV